MDNLSVIIGASPRVERLRRRLVRGGVRNLGLATSLPGLRRELIGGDHELVVSCLLLDEPTLDNHRDELRCLLADAESFHATFRCIGLVPDAGRMDEAVELGCHLYVRDPGDVLGALDALNRHHSKPPRCQVAPGMTRHLSRFRTNVTTTRISDRFGWLDSDPKDPW
ncbi:MAG: hypothetical protein O7G85_14230 [Planctomycetota bacterium]|nr:hypothetical protein [Planctomycetota bacterium]